MDKKKGIIIGAVGGVVVLLIILIFSLSGSSARDMIIDGKWQAPDADIVEFHDNGTISEYKIKDGRLKQRDRGSKDTWNLSDDEKTLNIKGRRPIKFNIDSISDDRICLSGKETFCMTKYVE